MLFVIVFTMPLFLRDTANFLGENARWLGGGFLLTLFSSFGQTFFIGLSGNDLRATFISLARGGAAVAGAFL